MRNTELAKALFDAFERGDADAVRAVCSRDVRVRQNANPSMDMASLIRFVAAVLRVVPDFHYENAVRTTTESGFVEEHDVCGTLPDGSALRAAACIVAEVRDGQIISVHEYIDTAAVDGLLRALRG